MIFVAGKFIIFIAVLVFFGWQFLRRVLKQNELYLLLPLSLALGIIAYTFFLNIVSYLIDVRTGFWLVLILLILFALALIAMPKKKIVLGIGKNVFYKLIFVSLIFGLFFGAILINNYAYDEEWHGGIIATIANGNFPVKSIYIPDLYIQYHYGFDLFTASLHSFVGFALPQSSDVAMILILLPVFWLVFNFVYKVSQSLRAAWLSAWLLFFGSGFRYLSVLKDISWGEGKFVWDYVRQGLGLWLNDAPMSPGYFHSYSVEVFGVGLYHRPTLFATLILLFVLWLMYLENKRQKFSLQIILALVLGFLALAAETWFILVALSWGLWRIYYLFNTVEKKSKNKILIGIITVTLISSLVVIFQGGVITDAFLHAGVGTAETSMSSFTLRSVPGLISYGAVYPINQAKFWFFVPLEWGLPLLLFIFSLFYFYKHRQKRLFILPIMVVLSLLIVFWIDYPVSSRELTRVNIFAFYIINISNGIFLAKYFSRRRTLVYFALFFMMLSPLFYNLRIFPASWDLKGIDGNYYDKAVELAIAKDIRASLKEEGAVLTATPYVVNQSWGRQVYWGNPEEDIVFTRNVVNNLPGLLREKSLDEISARGVRYVYANKEFIKLGGAEFIARNKNSLTEVYNKDDDYVVYLIK